jgi:hypothetical protein
MIEITMSRPDDRQVRRNRIKLLAILALFLLPPVSAWVVWKNYQESGAQSTTNAGTLVVPARPLLVAGLKQADGSSLAEADFRGRWTYVMFSPVECDDGCMQQLYLTRQIRLAMNKDTPRVQRLLVLGEDPSPEFVRRLSDEHADLRWVVRGAAAGTLLDSFRGVDFDTTGEQYFLVDPLGNLMMYYDLDIPTKGVMKDLQKLLKISQVG